MKGEQSAFQGPFHVDPATPPQHCFCHMKQGRDFIKINLIAKDNQIQSNSDGCVVRYIAQLQSTK